MPRIIAYFRVSTKRQGDSGLGLEGQRSAVRQFAESRGERVIATYTEVESGKKADRAELAKAIGHAKLAKATLVVAMGDGIFWHGSFSVPNLLRPTIGETICFLVDGGSKIPAVVTDVAGPTVYFRANGLMPTRNAS